jgi:hypothetical protein
MKVSGQLHASTALSPHYPLGRRQRGPQSRSGRCGRENNLLPLTGTVIYIYVKRWTVNIGQKLLMVSFITIWGSRDSSVSVVIKLLDGQRGSRGSVLVCVVHSVRGVYSALRPPIKWKPVFFSSGSKGRSMKLNINLHLVPKLIMCGAVWPHPNTSS